MYYNQVSDKPCAYITKGKQRVKQFGRNVYLKDGSEFELELYNPSRKTVLSKIKINGFYIGGGGIVLRPGERVFLERYLDDPKKFKFETYTVDGSKETENAILMNGEIEIQFYEEQDPIDVRINGFYNNSQPNYSGDIIGTTITTSNGNCSYVTDVSLGHTTNTSSVETGRVEKGSKSKQEFSSVNKDFNSWTTSISLWKILPESQKPVEKDDLITKCPKCSTKIKKSSWKFCPECGGELKRTKTEIIYTNSPMVNHNGRHYAMASYKMELDEFFEKNKNKLIYLKKDSIGTGEIRAIVID